MKVGPANERGGGWVCLIKYRIKNKNKIHDLRALIGRGIDDFPDPVVDSASKLAPISLMSILLFAFTAYLG